MLQKLLRLFTSLSAGRSAVCKALSVPWQLLGRGSCPGLEGAQAAQTSGLPVPHPWQVDPIPPACPEELPAEMKWMVLQGWKFGLKRGWVFLQSGFTPRQEFCCFH